MKHQGSGNTWRGEGYGHGQCCPMKTGNCKDHEMLSARRRGCSEVKKHGTLFPGRGWLEARNIRGHGPSPEGSSEGQP